MALNSVYRVRTQAAYLNQRVEFGLHLQDSTGTGSPAHLAPVWRDAMITSLAAAVPADVSWDQITINDTNPNGEASYILALSPAVPGTLVGATLPPQNAAVISLLSGLKGKRRNGRFYLFGLVEEHQIWGTIQGGQLTLIQAVADQLLAVFGTSGSNGVYRAVIYSPPTRPYVPKPAPPVHTDTLITPIVSTRASNIVRTQRRRALGVGR